jgi:hypothetical protein
MALDDSSRSGKRVDMPCGHDGHVVIGTFALCSVKGCTGQSCKRCGMGPLQPFVSDQVPDGTLSCAACGTLRWDY